MRRYRILIFNPAYPKNPILEYTSTNPDGSDNPNALDVMLDLPVTANNVPTSGGMVRIWGIPLEVIGQGVDLSNMHIQVYGGMSASFPLNNPRQYGLLIDGAILQSFGNWIGTEQTLDMVIRPSGGSYSTPFNFVINWPKGTTLQSALTNALQVAMPNVPISGTLNPNLVTDHDMHHRVYSLENLNRIVYEWSMNIIAAKYAAFGPSASTYPGVGITYNDGTLVLYDGTAQILSSGPIQIAFTDLIGQPTWVGPGTMQMTAVMRADIQPFHQIKLPQALITTTTAAYAFTRQSSVFSGVMTVNQVRHVGQFRQADAKSWVSTIDAVFA